METSTGFIGVHEVGRTGRFRAQATVKDKRVHLGYYFNPLAAAKARDAFVREHLKQARFNFDLEGQPLNCDTKVYEHWRNHYVNS